MEAFCSCIVVCGEIRVESALIREIRGQNLIPFYNSAVSITRPACALQEKLVALRKDGRVGDTLLLLEHTPVITLGRNAKSSNVLASPEILARRGVKVFECDRGGDVTFHGPGQLVAYPIFDLRGFPSESASRKTLGVIDYVRRLEKVLIRTCADFGIPAKRICWVDRCMDGRGCPCLQSRNGEGQVAAGNVQWGRPLMWGRPPSAVRLSRRLGG